MCEHKVSDSLLMVAALGLKPRIALALSAASAFLSPSRMDEALRSKILKVLQRQHFMTVATIRPDGYPQATTVKYIHDDLIVYFATAPTSQKASNIQLNNKVSVAIVD
jgi:pyridoxine/pyridoxamine 5'-phosphate oxidase